MRRQGSIVYEIAHQRLNFHVILSMQGKANPDGLEQALLHVLQHYPTLRTVLRTRLFGHFREVEEIAGARILEVRDLGDMFPDCNLIQGDIIEDNLGIKEPMKLDAFYHLAAYINLGSNRDDRV